GAVVVEVRRGVRDPAQLGDVELVPVVSRCRPSDEAGQQRPAGIIARATLGYAVDGDLVGARVARQTRRAWGKLPTRGDHGVDGTRTLRVDVLKTRNRRLRGRL